MIIYGSASLIIFLVIIVPIRAHMLRRLDRLAPGSLVFTVANRKQFADPLSLAAVGTELGERASTLTSDPAVTADSLGLSFWDNNPFDYLGCLDWDRISSIRVRTLRTPYPRWTSSAIMLDVAVGGATIPVPLLSPNGTNHLFGSRRESEFIAASLERLRTSAAA